MTESANKSPLWLFLDTEFADLDQPDLISIGIVSLSGHREFYAELPELSWYRHASAFTLQTVKPLLTGPVLRDEVELAARLGEWIRAIGEQCRMVTDAPEYDWEIMRSFLEQEWPANLHRQPRWLLPTEEEKSLYYRETGARRIMRSMMPTHCAKPGSGAAAIHQLRPSRMDWPPITTYDKVRHKPESCSILRRSYAFLTCRNSFKLCRYSLSISKPFATIRSSAPYIAHVSYIFHAEEDRVIKDSSNLQLRCVEDCVAVAAALSLICRSTHRDYHS